MSVAQVLGPIGNLANHAAAYAEDGWEIFPLRQDKAPIARNGLYDATSDTGTVNAWWQQHPDALIGCRIPQNVFILDIDPRHGGADTWNELKKTFGTPDQTRIHMSGRGDGGGHIWFQHPGTRLSTKQLDQWAKRNGTGHPIPNSERWSAGIDILHHTLRYTILPPSPHPDTGNPYHWANGKNHEITPAPEWLLELLEPPTEPVTPPAWEDLTLPPRATRSNPDSPAQWYTDNHTWQQILGAHGWRIVKGDGESDGSQWRHPTATSAVSATIRHECLFVYSTSTPFEDTQPGDPNGYTRFAAYATLEHRGNLSAAAKAARLMRGNQNRHTNDDILTRVARDTTPPPATTATPEPTENTEEPNSGGNTPAHDRWLPEPFWDSTPQLAHIKQAAEQRRVSPDAVLVTILCRIAAISGHTITLPPTPTPIGLTTFAAIAGPPGTGKSAAMAVARQLTPAPPHILDGLPLGSGEGLIESMFTWEQETDPETGKNIRVKRQTKYAAIFQADEGEILADLGARSGSTLMPTLRTAYTHGLLGQTNASEERRRQLPAGNYVFGFTMGIQPERAGDFLGDAGGGTPQRFLWAEATHPNQPDEKPEWPGQLDWAPPTPKQLEAHEVKIDYRRHELALHPDIVAEVDAHQLALSRGDLVIDEDDAHTQLVRLKTAGLLAILEHTLTVDLHHWALAEVVVNTSRAVRGHVQSLLRQAAAQKQHEQNERLARREQHISESKEAQAWGRATRAAARVVQRHDQAGEHITQGGGCTPRCVTLAIRGTDRKLVTTDDVLAVAAERGWVVENDGRWFPGDSKPA